MLFDAIRQDTIYNLRSLRKRPAFTLTAVLTLALAIGGNTTMFTVIRAVLVKPLEYRDPDRLVRISGGSTATRSELIKTTAHSYTGVGASTGTESVTFTGAFEPQVLSGVHVSADFLRILQVEPLVGRGFLPAEDTPAAPPVVMISAELWQRRFASDPQIAGKSAVLSGHPYTIVGVLPANFTFPFPGVDVWFTAPSEWPLVVAASRPLSPFLSIFGRLKPGVSLEQANAEMAIIQAQYARAHPAMLDAKPKGPVRVTGFKEVLVARVRSMLWMLFGAVGFVLLIACANVASLLLVRANGRLREFAVRAALGAARARLIRQLLAESVLLSLAGGALGVMLSFWSLRALTSLTSFDLPRAGEIHPDWVVLVFAAMLSLATGVLFGLAPALGASRPDLMRVLRTSGGTADQGVSRRILPGLTAGRVLVAAQVALSIVLLIGAALLMQSVANLRGSDVGFNPTNLLTVRISPPASRYATNQKRLEFYNELLRRLKTTPGIHGAAAALFLPMAGSFPGAPMQDAAKPPLKLNERPIAIVSPIMPGYFQALEIPFKRGRDFMERDAMDAPRVAIVDEGFARLFWPAYPGGEDPVGKRILVGANPHPAEIVAIVGHVHQNVEDDTWPQTAYLPLAQGPVQGVMLAVRTAGNPLRFANAVRAQLNALDKDQPISEVRSMEGLVDAQVGQRRLVGFLLASFACVAVALALIGMYGVIAYSVAQRSHELGIRRALGAGQGAILKLVVAQGLTMVLAGVVIGMGGALALTRVIKSWLFHVSTTDPATFAVLGVAFIMVALAATYIPARRALRIDPVASLRL